MAYRLLLLLTLASGCNTAHQLASADTVPAGEFRLGVGGAASRDPNFQGDTYISDSKVNGQLLIWGRYGLNDKTELSFWSMNLFGGTKFAFKRQLRGHRTHRGFALSVGGEVATQWAPESGDYTRNVLKFELWAPLHLGYRLGPDLALYLSPRHGIRYLVGGIPLNLLGGVAGIEIGEGAKMHIEASAFRSVLLPQSSVSRNEFGLAVGFSF
jgi:hypothetical protein